MGRVAVVTGAAQGIGRGIATRLAQAGAAVGVADLNDAGATETVELITAEGGRAVAVHIDVTDRASVDDGLAKVAGDLGPVEVLVNNVGWDELMPFTDSTEALWDKVIDINYKGALRMTHAALPGMVERGWGRIVNIGSDAGRVGSSMESIYSGAKGGIIAFTKTIAREVARRGVTANTVCPGPTDTPALRAVAESHGNAEKVIESMTKAVPMRRAATPADIAAAVAFFASEEAGYITGQTLSVSGGLTRA